MDALRIGLAIAATLALPALRSNAQIYDTNGVVVQTFAGSGFAGHVDGVGQETMFISPEAIVADSSGNLFVADGNYLRKITPDGTVSTFAGNGDTAPFGNTGSATDVSLVSYAICSMAIDHSNALWITIAANTGTTGRRLGFLLRIGDNTNVWWMNLSSNFTSVDSFGVCVDSGNNVYYSDYFGNTIYRYHPASGAKEVFAGSGNEGSADGNGIFTSFNAPAALACDAADNIYVWDSANFLIRRINQNRDVVTIAGKQSLFSSPNADGVGTNASFSFIHSMWIDNFGNVMLACGQAIFNSSFMGSGSSIRKMDVATNVVTIAGSFSGTGYTNGAGNRARFNGSSGVCVSGGTIYVADSNNYRIRSITNNPTAQLVLPANLHLNIYSGLQIVGTVGRTYQVQSSPDMANWTTRATLLLTSSPYLWIDQNPVSGNKFYRALLLP